MQQQLSARCVYHGVIPTMSRKDEQVKTIIIDTTNRGEPALWESGGGLTSAGMAIIITGKNGERLRPVYVARGGHLACGKHALFAVTAGCHIVRVSVARGSCSHMSIERIKKVYIVGLDTINPQAKAEVEVLYTFSKGEWNKPIDDKFQLAVNVACDKALEYHCRRAMYVDNVPRKSSAVS